MDVPCTVTDCSGSGRGAGPALTDPSATANLLPWHGQLMVPPTTSDTVQPWCVQVELNALNVPATGWVSTTPRAASTSPPPTGTSVVAASGPSMALGAGAGAGAAAG